MARYASNFCSRCGQDSEDLEKIGGLNFCPDCYECDFCTDEPANVCNECGSLTCFRHTIVLQDSIICGECHKGDI